MKVFYLTIAGPTNSDSDNDDGDFQIHRKMLRRRHVRKEQKELARRRKEIEEQERTRRENDDKEKSDETTIHASVEVQRGHIDPSREFPPSTNGISNPPSPPPPTTTVDAIFHSPDHKDHSSLRQRMVPNFSPIRSKKLRTRIF